MLRLLELHDELTAISLRRFSSNSGLWAGWRFTSECRSDATNPGSGKKEPQMAKRVGEIMGGLRGISFSYDENSKCS